VIYKNGSSFRQALEERLREIFLTKHIPITRLRKLIAFERYLARLLRMNPNAWILKGGLNIEIRLGQRARTTNDMDLLSLEKPEEIFELLVNSSRINLNDYFEFRIQKPNRETFDQTTGARYSINALLDGRSFEQYHIDVGVKDTLIEPPEMIKMHSYLDFANITGTIAPCYSINQQIAEKFHALTRVYHSGESSRVKDVIDILLLASESKLAFDKLRDAVFITFENRNTHAIPSSIFGLNSSHQKAFSRLSAQVGLRINKIQEANAALDALFNPIVLNKKKKEWDPKKFEWS